MCLNVFLFVICVELALSFSAGPSLRLDHLFGMPPKKKANRGSDPPETTGAEAGVGDINAEAKAIIQGLVDRLKGHGVFKSVFTLGKGGSAGFSLQSFNIELGQNKTGGQEGVGAYEHVGPLGA